MREVDSAGFAACQAWAAGLFEGEGSIVPRPAGRIRLQLKMTDEDVVRRFGEVVGGRVYGPYRQNSVIRRGFERKPFWCWSSAGTAHGWKLLHQWWPWLGLRRRARAQSLSDDMPGRGHWDLGWTPPNPHTPERLEPLASANLRRSLSDDGLASCYAWAAGLFEGEGCIATQYDGYARLMLSMTDDDVVKRMREAVGGSVNGPHVPRVGADGCIRKPIWTWTASGTRARRLLILWWPWLGWRRRARASAVPGLFPGERFPG